MIAPEQLAEDASGINIFLEGTDPVDRSTWTNYEYETRIIQTRGWNDALYFMPIHRDEINRNDMLVQNPLY